MLALLWIFAPASSAATAKKKSSAKKTTTVKKTTTKKIVATKRVAAKKNTVVKKVQAKTTVAKPKAKSRPVLATRPPAILPPITDAASAWQGCLNQADVPMLASQLGIEESRLATLVLDAASPTSDCTPYVAVTGGVDNSSLLMFQPQQALPVLMVHKSATEITVNTSKCDCPTSSNRVLTLHIPATEEISQLPPQIQWIANILVPSMVNGLNIETRTNYNIRIVVTDPTDLGPERLRSIELVESATGKRMDGAWWLDRPNGQGVMIGMKGVAYEQLLWQSPVAYDHQSRGVGPRMVTVRVKNKNGTVSTRRIVSRSKPKHYGVDMMAAKGTDVHAVADATVAFSGRQSGFGNVVILDHGNGYKTYYAHLSKIEPTAKKGAMISRGELIGLVGSTGHSTAPHLHFEVRQNNNYIDPFDESHQLDFWLLDADDQERLAMEILAPTAYAILALAEEE
ncbi:MAG: M23 family metallopeptidase [Bryobacteraceae bacterium]